MKKLFFVSRNGATEATSSPQMKTVHFDWTGGDSFLFYMKRKLSQPFLIANNIEMQIYCNMFCPSNRLMVASDWIRIDKNCDLTPANSTTDAFVVRKTVMEMQPLNKQPTETLTERHLNSCESCFSRSNKGNNKIMNMSRLYSVKIKRTHLVFCCEQKLIELNTFTNILTAFSFSDLCNWNHIKLDLKWIKLSRS